MKILLLNYEFPPLGGGAAKATFNIAKELAGLGHSVDVLTSGLTSQPHRESMHGFTVIRRNLEKRGGIRTINNLSLFSAGY